LRLCRCRPEAGARNHCGWVRKADLRSEDLMDPKGTWAAFVAMSYGWRLLAGAAFGTAAITGLLLRANVIDFVVGSIVCGICMVALGLAYRRAESTKRDDCS
jgi:hypothetical protein